MFRHVSSSFPQKFSMFHGPSTLSRLLARNAVHASRPIGHVRFRHNGLQPFGAISFALAAV